MHFKEGVSFDAAICPVQSKMPLLVTGKTMPVQVEGVSLCMAGLCCPAADGGRHVPWLELRGPQVASACIVCSLVLATRLLTHLAVGEDISEVLCPIRLGEPGSLVLLRTKAASLGALGGLLAFSPGSPGLARVGGTSSVFWQNGRLRWLSSAFD